METWQLLLLVTGPHRIILSIARWLSALSDSLSINILCVQLLIQCVPFTPLWEFISHAVPLMSGAPHSVRFWKWNSLQGNQGNHCGVNWILLISHPLSYTGPNTREYYGTLWLFAGLRRAVSPHLFLAALSTAALYLTILVCLLVCLLVGVSCWDCDPC